MPDQIFIYAAFSIVKSHSVLCVLGHDTSSALTAGNGSQGLVAPVQDTIAPVCSGYYLVAWHH